MRELPFPLIKTRRINERTGSHTTTTVHGMRQVPGYAQSRVRAEKRHGEIATRNFIEMRLPRLLSCCILLKKRIDDFPPVIDSKFFFFARLSNNLLIEFISIQTISISFDETMKRTNEICFT